MYAKTVPFKGKKKELELRWNEWITVHLSGQNVSGTIFVHSEVSVEIKGDKHGLDYWIGNNDWVTLLF